jgi:hypothetical protein
MGQRDPIAQTLTRHRDIKTWVARYQGTPAIKREPNLHGRIEPRLALKFGRHRPSPAAQQPTVDDGLSPVSWTAWLAELDRRQLALRITDRRQPAFEFVERGDFN